MLKKYAAITALGCLLISNLNHATPQEQPTLPLNEIRTFVDIFDRIKKAYVEEVDDKTLLDNAIKGMLSELDPHSAYLEPDAYSDLQINTSGEFGGLGIEVGMEDGLVKVISPIDDTPAKKAGILAGDTIIKIDGKIVKGLSLNEAVDLMRGKPGTDIELNIIREGEALPITVVVTRDIIQVKSVKAKLIEPGFGYLRLTQFQLHTAEDVTKYIQKLKEENETPLDGLVLDLRNNPGGLILLSQNAIARLLKQAAFKAWLFVSCSTFLSTLMPSSKFLSKTYAVCLSYT